MHPWQIQTVQTVHDHHASEAAPVADSFDSFLPLFDLCLEAPCAVWQNTDVGQCAFAMHVDLLKQQGGAYRLMTCQ